MYSFRKFATPLLIATLSAAMALGGCAAPGGAAGPNQADGGGVGCNPLILGGVGAVVGALVGGGSNTLRGATLGAGLGALACVAFNYHSEQVKSAQQVDKEYRTANRGRLPEQATLVKYETGFMPPSIRPGQRAQTNSYIEVAAGSQDINPVIEEELTLYRPNGEVIKTVRKPVATTSAGGFKNSFSIPMPEGVPQGVYPVKTVLYLNHKPVAGQNIQLQVAQGGQIDLRVAFAD